MNSKYTNIDDDNPNIVISSARANRSGTANILRYPSESANMPFYCKISLQNYNRTNPNSRPTSIVDSTIILPLPTQLLNTETINTDNKELGLPYGSVDSVLQAWRNGSMQDILNSFGVGWDNAALGVLTQLLRGGASDTASVQGGIIPNPHLTTIFQGVNLKTFNLSWKFSPRNRSDSANLKAIIKKLKQAQKPSFGNNALVLDYPMEAFVYFVPDVQKIRRSFIKTVTDNYTGAGQPAFFEDSYPVDVELALEFQELEIMTRKDVE